MYDEHEWKSHFETPGIGIESKWPSEQCLSPISLSHSDPDVHYVCTLHVEGSSNRTTEEFLCVCVCVKQCLGVLPGRGTNSESRTEFAARCVRFTVTSVLCARVKREHVHPQSGTGMRIRVPVFQVREVLTCLLREECVLHLELPSFASLFYVFVVSVGPLQVFLFYFILF